MRMGAEQSTCAALAAACRASDPPSADEGGTAPLPLLPRGRPGLWLLIFDGRDERAAGGLLPTMRPGWAKGSEVLVEEEGFPHRLPMFGWGVIVGGRMGKMGCDRRGDGWRVVRMVRVVRVVRWEDIVEAWRDSGVMIVTGGVQC